MDDRYTHALTDVRDRMRAHAVEHDTDVHAADCAALDAAHGLAKGGTMREWMTRHAGATVRTVQITVDASGRVRGLWCPGDRTVDSVRASYVTFDGSRRDYAGARVLGADADTLAVACTWGDDEHVIVYAAVTA